MKQLWITVLVESGIPTEVELFDNFKDAKKYKLIKEKEINFEDDSIEIFAKEINGKNDKF